MKHQVIGTYYHYSTHYRPTDVGQYIRQLVSATGLGQKMDGRGLNIWQCTLSRAEIVTARAQKQPSSALVNNVNPAAARNIYTPIFKVTLN